MNPQQMAMMAQLMQAFGGAPAMAPAMAPVAPAPVAAAPVAPTTSRQEVKVTRGVNAFKSTSGINKDMWMMSCGDLTCRWSSAIVPKSAFVKAERNGKVYYTTKTRWEVTFGISGSGRVYATAAVDTKEPIGTNETLDDIGNEESLDDAATVSAESVNL